MAKRMTVVPLAGTEAGFSCVNLYDENNKPVCYCGPYKDGQLSDCVALFKSGGWVLDKSGD